MAYILTEDLKTGNVLIDTEHQQLFDRINALLDACTQGKGRLQIDTTLKFLNDYIVKHFNDEEALQQKVQYPDYPNHKRYHESYKKIVKDVIEEFEKDGTSITLVAKVNTNIAGWLVNHIKSEDKKLASYIKQQGK